jgi:hypothetical protein
MQGAEERRLRRMSNTPQGGAIEGNAADDGLMVDQGYSFAWLILPNYGIFKSSKSEAVLIRSPSCI